jgi:hypothetical protein
MDFKIIPLEESKNKVYSFSATCYNFYIVREKDE